MEVIFAFSGVSLRKKVNSIPRIGDYVKIGCTEYIVVKISYEEGECRDMNTFIYLETETF